MKNPESSIVFKVCEQSFCLSIQYVSAILQLPRIFTVPQAPPYVLGVINVEGEVLPLIHAAKRLNMTVAESERPSVILMDRSVDGKHQRLGLYVDETVDVLDFESYNLQALPTSRYEFDERLVNGMFRHDDDFVMQINVDNFFKHNLEEININSIINNPS